MHSRCLAVVTTALSLATACKGQQAAGPVGAVEVGVVTLAPRAVTLTRELPGRTSAFRVAEVRARVNGIVLKRLFTEGSDVKEGQRALPHRSGALPGRARRRRRPRSPAPRRTSRTRGCRRSATPTSCGDNAVSRQEYDNAIAALKASGGRRRRRRAPPCRPRGSTSATPR